MVYREEKILPLVRDKRVLDCGGIDHSYIEQKRDRGDWLHAEICQHAESCLGVDILGDRVAAINREGKFHFVEANVEQLAFVEEFDVVVAGELIEHVYNAGLFLDSAWRALKPGGQLILTTPNAKAFSGIYHAMIRGQEVCHEEHTCYYSPQTLQYIVQRHGFNVDSIELLDRPAAGYLKHWFRAAVGTLRPSVREKVLIIATKIESQDKYGDKW